MKRTHRRKPHYNLVAWEERTPQPYYTSMEQAAQKEGFYGSKWKPGWPCRGCNGRGRIVDPMEQPDVIEGDKFSRRIDCPECKGTGRSSEADFKAWYDKEIARQQAKVDEHRKIGKILQRLNRKLSKAEARAIRAYHSEHCY